MKCQEPSKFERPVFFRGNRTFRVYLGGKLLSEMKGEEPVDGFFPEEWICSPVRAVNPGREEIFEGVSLCEEDGKPFDELLREERELCLGDRQDLGILVKYLDSGIRLPMQVHPTREQARELFGSPYGKTEAWLILGTRPGASIYLGFSREVTREELAEAVEKSREDREIMTSFVNRVPVKEGDVFLVKAGMIHAIGAGCLILEIQEPTDFTVQPEHWCGDYRLNDREMYCGLTPEQGLGCFNYSLWGPKTVEDSRLIPRVLTETDEWTEEELIGPEDTDCFTLRRFTLRKGSYTLTDPASVWICTEGEGTLVWDGGRREIRRGDYWFLPAAAAGKVRAECGRSLQLVCCRRG